MRLRWVGLMIMMSMIAAGCGGDAENDETGTTATQEPSTAPDATSSGGSESTIAAPTSSAPDGSDTGSELGLPEMEGGSATFTLAGETEEFDWFVCFYGDAAIEMSEDEDQTFVGIGRRGGSFPSLEGVEAQVVASQKVDTFGPNYTIFYTRFGGNGDDTSWQAVGDIAQLESSGVTFEGEMNQIIDNQPSDTLDPGSLDATCSPNSVGSG